MAFQIGDKVAYTTTCGLETGTVVKVVKSFIIVEHEKLQRTVLKESAVKL